MFVNVIYSPSSVELFYRGPYPAFLGVHIMQLVKYSVAGVYILHLIEFCCRGVFRGMETYASSCTSYLFLTTFVLTKNLTGSFCSLVFSYGHEDAYWPKHCHFG